ncbi:MAG: response regulator transcription factor [Lachnospiraceae bacterium]|jgi:two-component system response regulator LytT|nr:response regulator transcription factor [Lachnospiraceae bacterium]
MQIVIVEDNVRFAEQVIHTLNRFFTEKEEDAEICQMEGTELLEKLDEGLFCDVCLLDVEMPGMDGITLGQGIRKRSDRVRIVYLTAHERYAVPSYDVRAYGYILKGDYREKLPELLMRILEEEREKETEYYRSMTEKEGYKILLSDILYLEKDKKHVCFHCKGGKTYRGKETLENIMQQLPEDRFVAIDKGVAVNLGHVTEYREKTLTMRDGTKQHVSRRAWPGVIAKLGRLLGIEQ